MAILDQPVTPGDLYVVLPDNHRTASADVTHAVSLGATAVCASYSLNLSPACPLIEVNDERRALAAAGALLAGDPSSAMSLVGITGTNGKSTTAAMITRCLEMAGRDTGLLGSFVYWAGDEVTYSVTTPRHGQAHLTTPDGPRLHASLAAMAAAGTDVAVMEVTSQALLHRRVDDCTFDVGVLTRMGQDHLNLHGSVEDYHGAKRRLWALTATGAPVFAHRSDPLAQQVLGHAAADSLLIDGAVSGHDARGDAGAGLTLSGTTLTIGPDAARRMGVDPAVLRLRLPVPTPHDLENASLAAAAALTLGTPPEAIEEAMATYPGLPRRLQPIAQGPFLVIDSMLNDPVLDQALAPTFATLAAADPKIALIGPRATRGAALNAAFGAKVGKALAALGVAHAAVTRGNDVLPEHELIADDVVDAFVAGIRRSGGPAHRVFATTAGAVDWSLAQVANGGTLLLLGSEAVNPAGAIVTEILQADRFGGMLAGNRREQVNACVDPRGRLKRAQPVPGAEPLGSDR